MFIKYNRQNVHAFTDGRDIKWLQPGWNEFPDSYWNLHKEDPEVKQLMEDGHLELAEHPEAGKAVHNQHNHEKGDKKGPKGKVVKDQPRYLGQNDQPVRLMEIQDEKKVSDIIKNTFSMDLLTRWNDEENRSKVKRDIEKQIKHVQSGGSTPVQEKEDKFNK